MKKVLFIHRSVGHNLINDGQLYDLVGDSFELNDYDHNSGFLFDGKEKQKLGIVFEGENTNPENYALLFSKKGEEHQKKAHELMAGYDILAIKSCYPNSNITSEPELKQIKGYYDQIIEYFSEHPKQKLIIMTSPPLVKLRTYDAAATRARQLSDWLEGRELPDNVSVFNFYDLLANQKNMLREEYSRFLPFDSHPNRQASREVSPKLVNCIEELVQNK